jgi:large subunit ribosomal protein L10
MSANRDAKGGVVEAVRTRLDASTAAVVTEYRGLTVAEMAALRRALRAVGGDYKVFKNTLVRRAIEGSEHGSLAELLEGPTAIAFVSGDVSAVAKALRDFARGAPALIVKGGVLDGALLGAKELTALADLPTREVLLAQFAGTLAAPMRTMAGLLKALPQNFAYGLSALLEQRGGTRSEGAVEEPPAEAAAVEASAPVVEHAVPVEDAASTEDAANTDAAPEEAPVAEDATEAPDAGAPDAEAPDAEAPDAEAPDAEAAAESAGESADESA